MVAIALHPHTSPLLLSATLSCPKGDFAAERGIGGRLAPAGRRVSRPERGEAEGMRKGEALLQVTSERGR
jgi:hypothetical protein